MSDLKIGNGVLSMTLFGVVVGTLVVVGALVVVVVVVPRMLFSRTASHS